ncbi:MAG TPA: tRNA (N(6)-L-threonylcarbamoyladenosine(37)-C(2))-methylthiotransferase MtaB [Terriglobia bacterium]|nr:tRNA (N(6)-L-threonylcarbamoyladenosine(37)-C(2))-methylthiotransferase MtaB [Terriglobia bacterium]
MTTFRILNFGCRASQADGASIRSELLNAGFAEANGDGFSDLAVLNTCTVTATADAEVRQIIRRIHRDHPDCRVLVTGCYAQRAPAEIASLPGVAWVVGNSHKHLIPEVLSGGQGTHVAPHGQQENPVRTLPSHLWARGTGGEGVAETVAKERGSNEAARPTQPLGLRFFSDQTETWVGEISENFHFQPVSCDDRTRPTLKIQDGCNARCSFCIIPAVRGRSRSLPPDAVVAQVRALEEKGYREVVLSGINLGSYGLDLQPRTSFLSLLDRILAQSSLPRVRISSIEPMDVRSELIRLVAMEPRMAQHFHVPLQSGCDRTLRQMNRRYWTTHYAERILAIREMIPNCGIGADVMVGFPGETPADHSASVRFIDSLPFTYLHIFPYSARPSTPAAARSDQLNGRIAHERSVELRVLIARKRRDFMQRQVGQVLSALTLNEAHPAGTIALSSNYLKITLPETRVPPNQMVDIRIDRAEKDCLAGRDPSVQSVLHGCPATA